MKLTKDRNEKKSIFFPPLFLKNNFSFLRPGIIYMLVSWRNSCAGLQRCGEPCFSHSFNFRKWLNSNPAGRRHVFDGAWQHRNCRDVQQKSCPWNWAEVVGGEKKKKKKREKKKKKKKKKETKKKKKKKRRRRRRKPKNNSLSLFEFVKNSFFFSFEGRWTQINHFILWRVSACLIPFSRQRL